MSKFNQYMEQVQRPYNEFWETAGAVGIGVLGALLAIPVGKIGYALIKTGAGLAKDQIEEWGYALKRAARDKRAAKIVEYAQEQFGDQIKEIADLIKQANNVKDAGGKGSTAAQREIRAKAEALRAELTQAIKADEGVSENDLSQMFSAVSDAVFEGSKRRGLEKEKF